MDTTFLGGIIMITIQNLSKSFQKRIVLDQLSLSIHQGDLIYIHGINGSGKSTLLKIICGIIKQDEGHIIMEDDVHIGALIENPGFIENESLQYNLRFLASLKKNYHQEEIQRLCELFQLDFDNRSPIKKYSLGMRQKAGIIQAIMENQNLILLDEPTRGLDREAVQIFCQLIKQFHQEGKTIIIASHEYLKDLPFDYIYYLENGKLYAEDTF